MPWRVRYLPVEAQPEGWRVTDFDGGCDLRALDDPHLDPASWTLAKRPTPGGRSLDVWVTAERCASGHSAEGRIEPPTVLVDDGRIIVTIGVRPRPGGQDCPGHPAARYTLELPESLDGRDLLDGGVYPPVLVRAGST